MKKTIIIITIVVIVALVATVAFLGKTLKSECAENKALTEEISSLNAQVDELAPHKAWDVEGDVLYVSFDTVFYYSIEDAAVSKDKVGKISDEVSMSSLTGNKALVVYDSQTKLVAVRYKAVDVYTPVGGQARTVYALPGGMYVVEPIAQG